MGGDQKTTRRQFLSSSVGKMLALSCSGKLFRMFENEVNAAALPAARTRVCIVKSSQVWSGLQIDQKVVKLMLDEGIVSLTNCEDVSRAWKKLFDDRDTIALKVNSIARKTGSTKAEVCYALAECIHEKVGVPYDRFVIFDVSEGDLQAAGYLLTQGPRKIQVIASDSYSEFMSHGGVKARITRIVTDQCSALVNVPLLKTHVASGLSAALKNHYGSIPRSLVRDDSYRYHADGFKNLVHLNLMAPIREKTRLIIVDALRAQYHLGPGGDPRFQWNFNGMILGTDPVAVDAICLEIINRKRQEDSFEPLDVPYLKWAREEGLGTNLSEEILVYEKDLNIPF